jgi:hypothetical protein
LNALLQQSTVSWLLAAATSIDEAGAGIFVAVYLAVGSAGMVS